jgi:mono/diheme cytochrome c family protein
MCHGDSGKGNGSAAADFEKRPADLTDSEYADASDKELLRKIKRASRPMPDFDRLLSDKEKRDVAAYVRSLAGGESQRGVASVKD